MHHFAYRDGALHAEAVDIVALAEAVGTPFYCYSSATLERHYKGVRGRVRRRRRAVCYSLKANSNQAVIATLGRLGAGADVVSEGELLRARAAGIAPKKIMFSGVGKTARELALAVEQGILCVNVESEPELELLAAIAAGKGRSADISIRVNPDIDAKTHTKIATGKAENKFGIPISRAARSMPAPRSSRACASSASTCISAARSPSSIRSTTRSRCWPISSRVLRADGHTISHVDLGGGLGIPYREDNEPPPDPDAYAAIVKRATAVSAAG